MTDIDELTLARAKNGHRESVSALLAANAATVYAVVGRMLVKHPAAVDDLAQEVFVKAIRFLPRFRGNSLGELNRWLATMAARACLDYFRKPPAPEPTPLTVLDEQAGEQLSPEEETSQRELEARVMAAMGNLPAEQRAALILRAYHDFDYPEIAAALGVEVGTIKSRLNRARRALRVCMPEQGSDDE